jgi:hypothetical protein
VVGTTITDSAYDTSGGPVTVEVLDGTGHPLTTGTFSITIGLGTCTPSPTSLLGCGTGSLASASNTLTRNTSTSSGIVEASFGDLSINDIGGYQLGASAGTLPASSNATSDFFTIAQEGTVCTPGPHCTIGTSNTTTGTSLDAGTTGSGTLSLSLVKNAPLTCGTYSVVHGSASVADIVGSDFAGGTITLITSHSAAPGTGVGGFTICLASVLPFKTADGKDAEHVGSFYVGTLPNCSPKVQAPCIVSKNRSVPSSDLIITFRIAPGDPMWYD